MATDLDQRPEEDRIQRHYDDEFGALTSAEHQAKDGVPGDVGSEEAGFFKDDGAEASTAESETKKKTGRNKESEVSDTSSSEGFFSDSDESKKKKGLLGRFSVNQRRSIAGILVATILGGGAFFGAGVIQGPAQVIQLGHILSRPFDKGESDDANRNAHLLRWARAAKTGDIGQTRVGTLGSKIYGKTIQQLSDAGIEFEKGRYGQKTRTTFDIDKMKKANPELEKLSTAEQKSFIADQLNQASKGRLNIEPSSLQGSGGKFTLDVTKMTISESRFLSQSSVSLLNDGNIIRWMKARSLTKVMAEPSLFHPFQKAKAAAAKKFINGKLVSETEQNRLAEEEAQKTLAEKSAGDAGAAAKKTAGDKLNGFTSKITKGVTVQGFVCIIRDVSDEVIVIDRLRVVLPAEAEATRIIGISSQVQSGQDLTSGQVGGTVSNFVDKNGKSIWENKALQALAGGKTAGLADINSAQKSAFSSNKVALAISKISSDVLGGETSADVLCSTAALLFEGAVVITAAGLAEYLSGGLATPGVIALFAANQVKNAAVSIVGIQLLTSFVLDKTTTDALSKDAFRGLSGGGLLAYGSRAAANEAAMASGGIELGNEESTKFSYENEQLDKREFQSLGFAQRVFNINDSRTLAGRLIQSVGPSTSQNVASFANGFKHIGSTFSSIFSTLTPKAAAADKTQKYDWGFSQYGLTDDMLDDEALSDPYENGRAVATLLTAFCRNGDSVKDCDLRSRAMTCFAVDLTIITDPDTNDLVWDAVSAVKQGGIDPNSATYQNAHCNDTQDEAWRRVVMFINDTGTMKGAACYQGDAASCQELGSSTVNTTASTSETTVKVASYNMCQEKNHPASCPNQSGKVDAISKLITNGSSGTSGFDVIGAQELSQKTHSGIMGKLPNYESFPTQVAENNGLAVIWNTAKFKKNTTGYVANVWSNSGLFLDGKPVPGNGHPPGMPWVGLTDLASGRAVYVLSIHSPNDGFGNANQRIANAREFAKWASSKSDGNAMVIITGDFNSGGATDGGSPSSYCVITGSAPMQFALDMQKNSGTGACPTKSGIPIDQIYGSNNIGMTASGWERMDGNPNISGTDHSPAIVTFSIAGAVATGADAGADGFTDTYGPACTGKGGSTYGVACTGQCVDYVEYLLNKTYNSPGKYNSFGTGSNTVDKLVSTYGFKRDNSPQVGDVASWPAELKLTSTNAGHTAAVIKVNSDGSIVVAEWNWSNTGPITLTDKSGKHSFDTRTVPAATAAKLEYAHTNLVFNTL